MITFDVTDVQRRQIEAHSACVVPRISSPTTAGRGAGGMTITWHAPQPWLNATKPCETCGGDGDTLTHQEPNVYLPCPDCRDGHPIVELRAPCPRGCDNGLYVHDADFSVVRCNCVNGWVSLGRYTVKLLPVREGEQMVRGERAVVADFDGEVSLVESDGSYRVLTFDPLPVPGRDMVAVLTKVDAQS